MRRDIGAARVLPDGDIERVIEIVEDLEHATSRQVQELVGLLGPSPASQAR